MIYLISYDLNRHERPSSYTKVSSMIERNATSSIRILYSQWLVQTADPISTWSQRMQQMTDPDDRWLITQLIRSQFEGYLDNSALAWINQRI